MDDKRGGGAVCKLPTTKSLDISAEILTEASTDKHQNAAVSTKILESNIECKSCGRHFESCNANDKIPAELKRSYMDDHQHIQTFAADDSIDLFSKQINETSNNNNRFSEWIHCMCVVTFDLELGQAMEHIYPEDAKLSEQEKMNICYLAFPDSNSSCMGDTQYYVRLRLSSDNIDSYALHPIHRKFNAQCIPVQRPDLAHYWGFVYFRQKRDKTIPRGYFQKSFILLTRLPFFNLFNEIVSAIAPRYFNDGRQMLLVVYEQINDWPALRAGNSYALHLLGTVYQTIIPKSNSKSHNSYSSLSKHNNFTNFAGFATASTKNKENGSGDAGTTKGEPNNKKNLCRSCRNLKRRDEFFGPQFPPQVLTSVHEIDIFRSLSVYLSSIYMLWELVLIAEPIFVMGSSPADCSHMVQALVSLIYPLRYLAEYRPYFTIHDSEFREFTTPSRNFTTNLVSNSGSTGSNNSSVNLVPPSIILGVTNPFFAKLLQNWPNMIRLPDSVSQQMYSIIPKYSFGKSSHNQSFSIGSNSELASHACDSSKDYYSSSNPATIKMKIPDASNIQGGSGGSNTNLINMVTGNVDSNNRPGLYSKYKPFLKKDKSLIKKIQLGIKTKRPEQVQSALLRRHFLELTQSFMIPLERYMASLMPLQKDISPFKAAPNPNEFKQDDFLATLEHSGPHLTSALKGNWKGLYKRFFKSPNFKDWYENRYMELKHTLQDLQLQALSDADLNQWAQGRQEVEIVDMILKLKEKLALCSKFQVLPHEDVLKSSTRVQLLKQIDNIMQSLPDDLKVIIKNTT